MSLLDAFPPAWRRRYGEELAALLEEIEMGGQLTRSVRLDVLRAALRERVRISSSYGLEPGERAREGSLLVLYAWMLFVLGGFGVEKASEHWQAVTPPAGQGLASAAFDCLLAAAGTGSAFVAIGIALALPPLAGLVSSGGWRRIRRPLLRAAGLSLVAVAATAALAAWAHSLSSLQRNGGNAAYGSAFLCWVVLLAACLVAWAVAAAETARQLTLSPRLLRVQARLAAGVSAAMAVTTAASVVWWVALARAAPWFLDGHAVGSANGSALEPNLIAPVLLMASTACVGLLGASRALRAAGRLSARSGPS